MMKRTDRLLNRLSTGAGICLLVVSAALLLCWQWGIRTAEQKAQATVDALRSLIPTPQGTVLEARSDNSMAALSLEGSDFVGILEMPRYGSALPVCAQWGQISKHPCCLSGSIYDGTLQIGATSQKGQYDFYRELSVGDAVYFTDMEGNRYAYVITDIRIEKHASQGALQRHDAALTLFIKNIYAFEYLILFCDVLS